MPWILKRGVHIHMKKYTHEGNMDCLKYTVVSLLTQLCLLGRCLESTFTSLFVTEFWKITHMGTNEKIRIFMFSELLIRAGHSFKNISKIFSCK